VVQKSGTNGGLEGGAMRYLASGHRGRSYATV